MPRQSIPGNRRSRVLYTRDAWTTLQYVMLAWCRDCQVAIVASPGLGDWQFGNAPLKVGDGSFNNAHAHGKQDDDFDFTELLSDLQSLASQYSLDNTVTSGLSHELTGTITTSDKAELGTYALITLDKACAWLRVEMELVVKRMKLRRDKAVIVGNRGRFRVWLHWARTIAVSESFLALGIERLKAVCLTQQKRPRGPQAIDTRRPITTGYYEPFKYCGKWATRFPPGRPALSEGQWLERYRARRARQKKTNRTRNDKRGPVKIPKTRHGRPSREMNRDLNFVYKAKQSEPRFEYASDFDSDSVLREYRESIG